MKPFFFTNYGFFLAFKKSIKPSSEKVKFLLEKALSDWSLEKAHYAIDNEYKTIIKNFIFDLKSLIFKTGNAFTCLKELQKFNENLQQFINQIEINIQDDIKIHENAWLNYETLINEFKSILDKIARLNDVIDKQINTIEKAKETLTIFNGYLENHYEKFKKEEITNAFLSEQLESINKSLNKLNGG